MGKQEEIFDIYDEHMKPMGTAARSEVHAKGLWHRTFQCWVWGDADGEDCLLFQERHPDKDIFPGLLDISCAGHLLAGEQVEDGVRELEEELGLQVSFHELISCGIFAEEDILSETLIDREFCHLFLFRSRRPLQDYALQPDEVTGLYRIPLEHMERIAKGEVQDLRITGVVPDGAGRLRRAERIVSSRDFVPHPEAYYLQLMDRLERVKAGDKLRDNQ